MVRFFIADVYGDETYNEALYVSYSFSDRGVVPLGGVEIKGRLEWVYHILREATEEDLLKYKHSGSSVG
jgi:hypothetical protein